MPTDEQRARIAKFEALANQFPKSELPRFSLGQAYLDAAMYAEAEAAFAMVEALKPDYMMAVIHRAEALLKLGRHVDARPVVERGLKLAIAQNHTGPKADCEELMEQIDRHLSGADDEI